MAIKFEDSKTPKAAPAPKRSVKADDNLERGTEEPTEAGAELPFGKPIRPEKKGRRK